jgi:hypothetical protein
MKGEYFVLSFLLNVEYFYCVMIFIVGFDVLMVVVMKFYLLGFNTVPVGTDELSCGFLLFSYIHPNFRQADCLLPASSWFLAWIFFNPEDGGDLFLRNVG